ncbi:Zinc finger CCHC domain-containing protein 4 [Toxocara canis]|uniref:Zinc finger CCHC domain-containing protein 4 n=1 Tax=Toxocara canis TaxID=6265 RepID=A0A0B2W142_TOXCA|nr:Zinc finger CCHC domain-containing protein 4 [Toxocara canis]
MQQRDHETSTKKRTRRSKKSHRGMAALKRLGGEQNMRKGNRRRSRREAHKLQLKLPSKQVKPEVEFQSGVATTKRKAGCALRERLNFCVLDTTGMAVPSCAHGPCLLFGRRSTSGEIAERFFGCAVYRSNICDFRLPLEDTSGVASSSLQRGPISCKETPKFHYGKIRKSVNRLVASGASLYYCADCNDAVSVPHKDPVVGPLKYAAFRRPTHLIKAVLDDGGEAQYWFIRDCLHVIANALTKNGCDGVLCIGVPTLFEHFRCTAQRRASIKSFLLDLDSRFSAFYLSSQFAQFSMLTNYFYDPASSAKLKAFLTSVNHLAIVCDPPFRVIVEPLFTAINQIKQTFEKLHFKEGCQANLLLVLPVFVAKHVKQCQSGMEIVDYKVCYTNHSKYTKAEKSVVRIFTDFPLSSFVLPSESGYRFCEMCERYVSAENRHCGLCGICPSKDGSPYHHCDLCNRCVKDSYRHCRACKRCHLVGRCLLYTNSLSNEETVGDSYI